MNAQNEPDFQNEVWQRIRKVIDDIVKKSADGDYIYRGEYECYAKHNRSGKCENCGKCDCWTLKCSTSGQGGTPSGKCENCGKCDCCGQLDCCKKRECWSEDTCYGKVSSGLYRNLPQYGQSEVEDVDLPAAQRAILDEVKGYTTRTDEFEILTELQHFGGETNFIDFTTDYLIALFFACDGAYENDGRVVLLQNKSKTYEVRKPPRIVSRVEFQRSVFVQPKKGYVEPARGNVVRVPAGAKKEILKYLEKHHSISVKTVYNDLHGFIERSAPMEVHRGSKFVNKGRQKDNHQEKVDCYAKAIEHYDEALRINPEWPYAYYNRGVAYFLRAQAYYRVAQTSLRNSKESDIDQAIEDFNKVIEVVPPNRPSEDFLARVYNGRGMAYDLKEDFCRAIKDYNTAIKLDPTYAVPYTNRGEVWLRLKEWDKAEADLTYADDKGVDIVDSFRQDYKSVSDFEKKNRCRMPREIKEMLQKKKGKSGRNHS